MHKMSFSIGDWSQTRLKSVPKQDHEFLSDSSFYCLCKAWASSWTCSINPSKTKNLSLLLPWTVSARQATLPGQLVHPFTGPFYYSCFSVKSCSPVLLGPYYKCKTKSRTKNLHRWKSVSVAVFGGVRNGASKNQRCAIFSNTLLVKFTLYLAGPIS